MTAIAPEEPEQRQQVLALNRLAFEGEDEARIIEALSRGGLCVLSLVAVDGATITGHILFSRLAVEVDGRQIKTVALAPMAVLPAYQGKGIGSALIRRGLALLAARDVEAVIVVGHTGFYQRFGFAAERVRHIASPFQGHDAYMGLELKPGALAGKQGTCRYPEAFAL
ncbi:GNAT family N-acetyltransferase [Taklimakanibacter deserti]|uniref:GNAT family N-acetyltransferase n=1 Tax=Taklimakanibacter deserti TaxID=2267839 RepID=UPI000E64CDF9